MLGLSQRHAVAGDDDDLLRACENLAGTVFGGLVRCGGLGVLRSGVGRAELVHGLLRVAEHQGDAFLAGVDRVLDAGVAGLEVVVADEDMLGLLHVQNGHAVDRGALGGVGSRVRDVVRADHNGCVAVRKAGVDLLHLMQLLVRHVGLSQKHVHVTGHTARDRMDGELDVNAVGLEGVGQLLDLMLGLSQRHAVAGDDDDALGGSQDLAGGLLGLGCRSGFGFGLGRGSGVLLGGSSSLLGGRGGLAEENIAQMAVHGLAHDLGQQEAGRADHAAHGDQQRVTDGHTGDRAGDAGEGVQQGDRDGHIRTADAQGEGHAEEGGEQGAEQAAQPHRDRGDEDDQRHRDDHEDHRGVEDELVALPDHGASVDDLMQLAAGDQGAGEGNHAHGQGDGAGDQGKEVHALPREEDQGRQGDQGGGCAAEAVEQGDDLGHFDHLDPGGPEQADHQTDRRDDQAEPEVGGLAEDAGVDQRQDDGGRHAEGGEQVAGDGGPDLAHQGDADQDAEGQDAAEDIIHNR